jgi:hypothetical protein
VCQPVDISQPAKMSAIRSVAVIRAPEPKTYTVMNLGHPGMAFGIIGGLAAAGDQMAKQDRLSAAFKAQRAAFTDHLAGELVGRLVASGYDARLEPSQWKEVNGGFQPALDELNFSADAVLVISPRIVGFVATGPMSDYLPTMAVVIGLWSPTSKDLLYRGYHAYGWTPKAEGWKSSVPTKSFTNFDALMSDTRAAEAALRDAGAAISQIVISDLRK